MQSRVVSVLSACAGFLSLLVVASGAAASTITFQFSGTIYTIVSNDPVPSVISAAFSVGDPWSITVTVDSNASDVCVGDTSLGCYGAQSFDIDFSGYHASAGSGADVEVDNDAGIEGHRFGAGSYTSPVTLIGPALGSYVPFSAGAALTDSSASVFSTDSLLQSFELSDFDSTYGVLTFVPNTGFGTGESVVIIGTVTSLSISGMPIPEPGTLLLTMTGLLGLAHRQRRHRCAAPVDR